MPLPDRRLQIEYTPETPETRRRFSICHEIAHTFFPDYYEQIQHRRKHGHFDPVHAELELLCHVGAGELLMPFDEFTSAVADRTPSMRTADELGIYFNASQEASLRRMVDLTDQSCCLLWVSERLKPTEERSNGPEFDFGFDTPKPKLRVDYQFSSQKWRAFIPKHKSVPDESLLYAVVRGSLPDGNEEDWTDLNLNRIHVEAVKSIHCDSQTAGLMVLLKSL